MQNRALRALGLVALLLAVAAANATSIPRLSFEQLVDQSEVIASGQILRSWTAWDAEHKYIWTHYELAVSSTAKGQTAATVEFNEPGGVVGGMGMSIAGTVSYAVGANVAVFLARMPNGTLRTAGWAQGRYDVDSSGRLHGMALSGTEMVNPGTLSGTPLTSLEGLTVRDLVARVTARLRAQRAGSNQ